MSTSLLISAQQLQQALDDKQQPLVVIDCRFSLADTQLGELDAREAPRYRGEQEPIDPIAGHIPGAINIPWSTVTQAKNAYANDIQAQKLRWRQLPDNGEVIVYCGSGVTACANLLSLEIAGVANAKLYVGGWSDGCSYPENPMISPLTHPQRHPEI